jgi:hypothetical protein
VSQAPRQARSWLNSSPPPSLAMSPMDFSLMASDLRGASQAWLRAAVSCSRDARDYSSSAWTSERQARTIIHGGLGKRRKTGPRFNTHSEAAPTST